MLKTQSFYRYVASFCMTGILAAAIPSWAQQAPAQGPMSLKALKIESQDVVRELDLPGRASAYQSAEIRPQVTGIITERLYVEGGYVEEGQQLYQIDPTPYVAAYESAVADLRKAQSNVKSLQAKIRRYDELLKINAVSRQDYDDLNTELVQAKADIGIAEATIARAKVNVDYTKVYAPISGIIGKSNVTKGALVTSGQAEVLTKITQLDPIYVDLTQSSAELMRFRRQLPDYENSKVAILMDGESDPYEHLGDIQFFDVNVDQTTGAVQLRALFKNPDGLLLPGMFVRGRLLAEQPEAILVPQFASARQPDSSLSVWVVNEQGQAEIRKILTSGSVGNQWIVTEGLQEGDVVITEGLMKIGPGVPVEPVFESSEQPASKRNI